MRTVKIVNHSIEDASETELIVRGATIAINRNSKGKEHYLSFDLCHEEDVDWIINALSAVSRCLKNQHLSPSDTKSQFAKMRQMLAESGGDGL